MRTIELCEVENDGKSALVDVVDVSGRVSLVGGELDTSRGCDNELSMLVGRAGALSRVGEVDLIDLRVASSYDADGNLVSTNVVAVEFGENAERFEWRGREINTSTGLQFNRARHFDPHQGRWLDIESLGSLADDDVTSNPCGEGTRL